MSANLISTSRFLTEREVASYLQVSVHALRRWRYERKGPPVTKISSLCRYSAEGLAAWLASQPKGGQQEQELPK